MSVFNKTIIELQRASAIVDFNQEMQKTLTVTRPHEVYPSYNVIVGGPSKKKKVYHYQIAVRQDTILLCVDIIKNYLKICFIYGLL